MLLGNKHLFGLDIEWLGINANYFLVEDQYSIAKLKIYVRNKIITKNNKQLYTIVPIYSFAKWIKENYEEILEPAEIPFTEELLYSNPYDLINYLKFYIKNEKVRNNVRPLQKWLNNRTINSTVDSLLPTLTFIHLKTNLIGVVFEPHIINTLVYDQNGFDVFSINDIEPVFKNLVVATAIHLRHKQTVDASKQLLRW